MTRRERLDWLRSLAAILALACLLFGFACHLDTALWIVLRVACIFGAVVLCDYAFSRNREGGIVGSKRVVGLLAPPDDTRTWSRGLSPWHADAFPSEFRKHAPEQGVRKHGWYKLDGYGNQIGWVPDGTEIVNPKKELSRNREG